MMERHALWSSIASNRGASAHTKEKMDALKLWNEVTFCERFKYTREYYRSLPSQWVNDAIAILNLKDHYSNKSSTPTNGRK